MLQQAKAASPRKQVQAAGASFLLSARHWQVCGKVSWWCYVWRCEVCVVEGDSVSALGRDQEKGGMSYSWEGEWHNTHIHMWGW